MTRYTSRFVEWLDEAMYQHGGRKYRQKNLAQDLGLSRTTISMWFNELNAPDDGSVLRLALHFKVEPGFIYGLLGKQSSPRLNGLKTTSRLWRALTLLWELDEEGQEQEVATLEKRLERRRRTTGRERTSSDANS